MTPVIGSLCSGYGGLDMALSAVTGGRVAWHVEYDKNPSAILAHRFPGVPNHGDLTTLDYDQLEPIDWLTAGYPCQPFSHAGKRKGASDERHLWPYVAAAVGALRPRGVLLENVRGHVSLGLDSVLADLAAMGYDARWGVVRASEAGAPHQRARVFVVAHDADAAEQRRGRAEGQQRGLGTAELLTDPAADAENNGQQRGGAARHGRHGSQDDDLAAAVEWGVYGPAVRRWERITGRSAPRPTEPGRVGERLSPRFVEWLMGLPDGWVTAVPGLARNVQLKALGNGVVPQQAALAYALLAPADNEVSRVA